MPPWHQRRRSRPVDPALRAAPTSGTAPRLHRTICRMQPKGDQRRGAVLARQAGLL
ncbi:hypothetical protein ACFYY2_20290 [Streptomyces sp. NPDC001822]|uniref:hypothetical protein n=1 Tax=Streptomyces sp. NPDC001822 TaxID=3364614 RepID=UPI003682F321